MVNVVGHKNIPIFLNMVHISQKQNFKMAAIPSFHFYHVGYFYLDGHKHFSFK